MRLVSPIHLPEILRMVFLYLTRHQIRHRILPVCKLWNIVGHATIPRVNAWFPNHVDRMEQLLNLGTDVLRCIAPVESPNQESWSTLETVLRSLHTNMRGRIKTVIMGGNINLEMNLFPLLPIFCQIRVLRLENLTVSKIQLDTILRLCPHLLELYISLEKQLHQSLRILYFEIPDKPLPTLKLKSLTFWRLSIDINDLEHVLTRCPDLQELRLIHMGRPQSLHLDPIPENTNIFSEMAVNCPRLRLLHYSSSSVPLSRVIFERIFSALPNLKTWSSGINGIGPFMFSCLQEHIRNLTTLEIFDPNGTGLANGMGIHQFLCTAPNLLHLRADGVRFMEEEISVLADLQILKRTGSDPENENVKKIWACRNLRTLRLEFGGYFHKSGVLATSRALFAYIVNVCPKLTELYIHHTHLALSRNGGFCLLSGLEELERLEILSYHNHRDAKFPERDMEWFRSDGKIAPATPLKLNEGVLQGIPMTKFQKVMRGGRMTDGENPDRVDRQHRSPTSLTKWPIGRAARSPDSRLISDIKKASSLENVTKVLEKLCQSDTPCWPLLESLKITAKINTPPPIVLQMTQLKTLISELRPELEPEESNEVAKPLQHTPVNDGDDAHHVDIDIEDDLEFELDFGCMTTMLE
ncbi:hypothetical protein BGX20_000472, partial [Mortierella sp. AD010]